MIFTLKDLFFPAPEIYESDDTEYSDKENESESDNESDYESASLDISEEKPDR